MEGSNSRRIRYATSLYVYLYIESRSQSGLYQEGTPDGKGSRPKPERLAEKLRQIRLSLGLSQAEMHRSLGLEEEVEYTNISKYELGRNEPPLSTLLQYARVAGVHLEDIVDDELDLPEKLPGNVRYRGIKRSSSFRKKRAY